MMKSFGTITLDRGNRYKNFTGQKRQKSGFLGGHQGYRKKHREFNSQIGPELQHTKCAITDSRNCTKNVDLILLKGFLLLPEVQVEGRIRMILFQTSGNSIICGQSEFQTHIYRRENSFKISFEGLSFSDRLK